MDKNVLMVFYGYAQKNKVFGGLAGLLYRFSSLMFFLIYYAGGLFLIFTNRPALTLYLAVPAMNLLACAVIRRLIKRKRPYLALGLTPPKNKAENLRLGKDSYSFPSNHSSSAGIIAFACMYINPAAGAAIFLIAVFTGISRVCAAVHYPSDVLAGFILSAVFAILGFNLLPLFIASL